MAHLERPHKLQADSGTLKTILRQHPCMSRKHRGPDQPDGWGDDAVLAAARRIVALVERTGKACFVGLLSGGKDSLVVTHVMHRLGKLHGVVFIDTTIGLEETRTFVKETCAGFGWPLTVIRPQRTYADFVMKSGFPKAPLHSAVMRELKWKPLRTFVRRHPQRDRLALISGTRRHESKRRFRLARPVSRGDGMTFVAPLFDVPTEAVWRYLDRHKLPVNPVYQTLHLSGDCLCDAFSRRNEAALIAQFYPAIARRIRELEARCPKKRYGTWGNGPSMETAARSARERFVCGECQLG